MASLLLAFCLPLAVLSANGEASPSLKLVSASALIGQFEKIEFSFEINNFVETPIGSEDPEVQITLPGGKNVHLPAFWYQGYDRRNIAAGGQRRVWLYPDGTVGWRARFAPTDLGPYEARALLARGGKTVESEPVRFNCVPSSNPGFVRISQKDPRFLEFSDGRPFFAIGENLAFIGPQQYMTLPKTEDVLKKLAANGANYLRVWASCDDWAMAIEARKSTWGRSWDWHPPFVAMPDTAETNRLCLQLTAAKPTLEVNPSYQVALRPATRYVVRGKIRTDGDAQVRLDLPAARSGQPLGAAPQAWTSFARDFTAGSDELWLDRIAFHLEGSGKAWLAEVSLREAGGGPELLWEADVNRPPRGFYNQIDSFMLDELLAGAERSGIYLQLCLLTRDLYMNALQDPNSQDYTRAISDAQKLFRYAVARWGYSTSVAAWEYWNEMNPNLPTDRFYTALGEFLESNDPYAHLRTTSTWGPSVKDCRHPKLDIADTHFYLRPADKGRLRDEVEAVLERTHWLREQAPAKPAHLGEFGLADDQWRITDTMKQNAELADVHNALWASALSGASGTVLPWWWERIDQRDGYSIYRPLIQFIADVPWTGGSIEALEADILGDGLRFVGLRAGNRGWFWLFRRDGAWASIVIEHTTPTLVENARLDVKSVPEGNYHVQWVDTPKGTILRDDQVTGTNGELRLAVPPFSRDVACKFSPAP